MEYLEQLNLNPAVMMYLVPVLIFLARILDVSIGTIRIILVARDRRALAAILGFLEVLIWLAAISQIISNLTNVVNYLAYAAGFAAGTWVGMTIERRLAIGTVLVRIIAPRQSERLYRELEKRGYRFTSVPAEGSKGPVTVLFTIVARSGLTKLQLLLKQIEPEAFYTVEDIRLATQTYHNEMGLPRRHLLRPFLWFRKSK
jgi:uncharacterized protein YebE (UPF0316 family)